MNEEIRQTAHALKNPTSYGLITYAWVVALSAWGGTVRFIRKIKAGEMNLKQASLTFFGEVITSAFAGVITFYACEVGSLSQLATAIFVGVAGHMGGRALEPIESIYRHWFGGSIK
jgi:hypothetical protein